MLEGRVTLEQATLVGIALKDKGVYAPWERTTEVGGKLSESTRAMEEVYAAIIVEEQRPVVMVGWARMQGPRPRRVGSCIHEAPPGMSVGTEPHVEHPLMIAYR